MTSVFQQFLKPEEVSFNVFSPPWQKAFLAQLNGSADLSLPKARGWGSGEPQIPYPTPGSGWPVSTLVPNMGRPILLCSSFPIPLPVLPFLLFLSFLILTSFHCCPCLALSFLFNAPQPPMALTLSLGVYPSLNNHVTQQVTRSPWISASLSVKGGL